jgi:hypothetical protein
MPGLCCVSPFRIMLEGRCAVDPELCKGCASPYAFETALRLLEIEEEIVGARMTRSTSQGVSTHNALRGLSRSSSCHGCLQLGCGLVQCMCSNMP